MIYNQSVDTAKTRYDTMYNQSGGIAKTRHYTIYNQSGRTAKTRHDTMYSQSGGTAKTMQRHKITYRTYNFNKQLLTEIRTIFSKTELFKSSSNGVVGAVVRSLPSNHKVPSSNPGPAEC